MMITKCAVMGPFVTEQSTVGLYNVLVFESPQPQKRAGCSRPFKTMAPALPALPKLTD